MVAKALTEALQRAPHSPPKAGAPSRAGAQPGAGQPADLSQVVSILLMSFTCSSAKWLPGSQESAQQHPPAQAQEGHFGVASRASPHSLRPASPPPRPGIQKCFASWRFSFANSGDEPHCRDRNRRLKRGRQLDGGLHLRGILVTNLGPGSAWLVGSQEVSSKKQKNPHKTQKNSVGWSWSQRVAGGNGSEVFTGREVRVVGRGWKKGAPGPVPLLKPQSDQGTHPAHQERGFVGKCFF